MNDEIELYNIKETKELIRSGILLKNAVKLSKADNGKVDFPQDLVNFFPLLTSLPIGIGGADKIPNELTDLSSSEIEELELEFGELIKDDRWRRVFRGLVVAGDAIVEIVNEEKEAEAL